MARISDNPIVSGYLKIYPKPDSKMSFGEYCKVECEVINMYDDFGAPTGEANEEDKPTGDGGAGMGMSIMDGYNNKLKLSM